MKVRWLNTFVVLAMLLVGLVPVASAAPQVDTAGTAQTYVVLYKTQAVASDAAAVIAQAGGTLVSSYNAIGVVIARSDNSAFAANLLASKGVEGVSATAGFGVKVNDQVEVVDASALAGTVAAGAWGDPLSFRQWDMTSDSRARGARDQQRQPECGGGRY